MRPSLLFIATLVIASWATENAAVDRPYGADEIVARYIVAIGGADAVAALDNLVYRRGLYTEGDFSTEFATMSRGRPFHKLVGDKNAPGDFMEGYDGSAWEWFADPGVVLRTVGAASAAGRHYAGVEPPLVDYRAKGSSARVLGQVKLDGRPTVALELTRRDGFVEQIYLDRESALIVASGNAAPIHAFGETVQKLTRFSDYRPVGGVLIAHRSATVEMPSGRELWSMQWNSIEANRDLPGDWFSPPVFTRTPLQSLVENLYQQRDDAQAALWTYEEFRLAYPDIDTQGAVDFAGYQIVKMGQHATAIALLERNVAAHPKSADTRFGLARALLDAGRDTEARTQLAAALAIDPEHPRALAALGKLETD